MDKQTLIEIISLAGSLEQWPTVGSLFNWILTDYPPTEKKTLISKVFCFFEIIFLICFRR